MLEYLNIKAQIENLDINNYQYQFNSLGKTDDINMCVKEKLDAALRNKLTKIRKKQEAKATRLEMMSKGQKQAYNRKKIQIIESNVRAKKTKTPMEEESDVNEAYQLILSEHHRRVNRRVRHKLAAMNLTKMTISTPAIDDDPNLGDDDDSEKQGIFPRFVT